ncbi:hypothetical protein ENSA7_75490 [Enhygromyxa salina]|uniref:Uncharacterized protein n=1 Tax=Enhygromyxa salina TaxID=215803 RepID=A0A2S9XQV0_9BACT|nr:hypothetical protein ENSA7_75490 [Enhygromyxa salina]
MAALVCWGVVAGLGVHAPAWIEAALERAFTQTGPALPDPSLAAAALLGLLATLAGAAMLLHGRRQSRRKLGVEREHGEIPSWVALGSCAAALVVALVWLRSAPAAAARSVDVAGVAGLWAVWSGWLGRGLLVVALVAAGAGVIERLVSARQLWQGLHLTRTQQRARARASGSRGRRR